MMKRRFAEGVLVCGLGLGGLCGCADTLSTPFNSALFTPPPTLHGTSDGSANSALTVAAAIPPDAPVAVSPEKASVLPAPTTRPFDALQPLDALQPAPATMPAEEQTADSVSPPAAVSPKVTGSGGQGVYMTLGCVIVQVNNTPIYATQVLNPLRKELATKAREMNAVDFKEYARQAIAKQLQELIRNEVIFESSYHELNDDDRKLAEGLAMQTRQERVTAAGGSVERAKRISLDEGQDFDDSIKEEYRHICYILVQRRIIDPLVQVTADDMREYYRLNVDKQYSEKDKAQFRVIEIDPAVMGGLGPATDKIANIRERALRGEDFGKLAATENQNDFLKSRAGNPCDEGKWMERNCYKLDAVEAEVWKLQPGQITPVIKCDGALYIARLDAKRVGTVRQFEDQTVQDDIYNHLHQQRVAEQWDKRKSDSADAAIVTPSDEQAIYDRAEIAVEMAMQIYGQAH